MRKKTPDFIAVGYVEKAHGIRGKVKVRPLTDDPQRFHNLKTIILESPEGHRDEKEIVRCVVRGENIYLRLKGVHSREEAQQLKGATILIRREECRALKDDEFFYFEVIGLPVKTVNGDVLGYVEDVWELPANDVFIVKKGEKEYLIPVIKQVIKKLDTRKGEIIIEPLQGLLSI